MEPEQLNDLIRRRRAVFPPSFDREKPIPGNLIRQILENANWAPTHRLTEPWRFIVFQHRALERLGDYLGEQYRQRTPPESFSEKKLEKTLQNPRRSACVIAICLHRDPENRVPEWEEIAAVSCAVQNMWLSCTAYGIGCYWSTPASILEAASWLELPEGERCLGLLYMGYPVENLNLPGKRAPVEDKVRWLDE
ncbi:MAG TPA: nitroreductase [Flavilitoribacter sp.]|nr:nitroreductase [Flavilitoribacter sp.]HMQ85994.1 nitroreductase [Flavilitoribacter sp.]